MIWSSHEQMNQGRSARDLQFSLMTPIPATNYSERRSSTGGISSSAQNVSLQSTYPAVICASQKKIPGQVPKLEKKIVKKVNYLSVNNPVQV
jgi:hypothetical protein